MYTIKEASTRSGVGMPLIRAWERRYGVVTPSRTPAGYRLYDDGTIGILRAMRRLVADGWTASEAARAIRAGEVDVAIGDLPDDRTDETRPEAADRPQLIEAFVRAAEATSPAATEAALDAILAAGSFEAVVDDILLPAAAALGTSWEAGRLSVAGEHAASAAVARRLAGAYQAAGVAIRPAVIVGLPPGARHELGALAFAVALRRQGIGVLYLGSDVPVDSWTDVLTGSPGAMVVLGVVTPDDRGPARDVVAAIEAHGRTTIAVGGPSADRVAPSDRVLVLPDRVVDAAAVVAGRVGRLGSRR